MKRIAHIINPVCVDELSDLFVAQPITFKTMTVAREYAYGDVEVDLFSAQYPEDRSMVPNNFRLTPDLDRSILDVRKFKKNRKLPLIKDIMDRLHDASDAEYFIYSNVDIALMPYFYSSVVSFINEGYDAFVINKRIISKEYSNVSQIWQMFSQIGEQHPGHDCFVFKKSMYPKYNMGTACIGASWMGRVFFTNLICNSKKFKVFHGLHLSFHVGDERSWRAPIYKDYDEHNKDQLHRILLDYKTKNLLPDEPLTNDFLQAIENPNPKNQPPKPNRHLLLLKNIIKKSKGAFLKS